MNMGPETLGAPWTAKHFFALHQHQCDTVHVRPLRSANRRCVLMLMLNSASLLGYWESVHRRTPVGPRLGHEIHTPRVRRLWVKQVGSRLTAC